MTSCRSVDQIDTRVGVLNDNTVRVRWSVRGRSNNGCVQSEQTPIEDVRNIYCNQKTD